MWTILQLLILLQTALSFGGQSKPKRDVEQVRSKQEKQQLDLTKLTSTLDALQTAQTTFQNQLNEKSAQLSNIQADQYSLQVRLSEKVAQYSKLDGNYNILQIQLNEKVAILAKIQSEKNLIELQLNEMSTKVLKMQQAYTALQTSLTDKLREISKMFAIQEHIRGDLDDKFRGLVELGNQLRNLELNFGEKSLDVAQLKLMQNGLGVDMKEKSQLLRHLKSRENLLAGQLNEKIIEMTHLDTIIDGAGVTLLDQTAQLTHLILEQKNLWDGLRQGRGRMGVIMENFEQMKIELDHKGEELQRLRHAQGTHESQLNLTNHRLTELVAATTNLEGAVHHFQQNPVPEGFVYMQLPGGEEPRTLWPNILWVDVTPSYAGLFFRAEGGGSTFFGEVQEQSSPHIVEAQYGWEVKSGVKEKGVKFQCEGWSGGVNVGVGGHSNPLAISDTLRFRTEGCHVHPRNQAVRFWRRLPGTGAS